MTYNDGIEAAADVADELAQSCKATAAATPHAGAAARWRMRATAIEGVASAIRDLKRPEPSEEEKVERVKSAIAHALCIDLKDPEGIARAAIKAMEG